MEHATARQNEKGTRGPLRRMSGTDALAVRELLTLAMQTVEPDDQTQRQLFGALMPELFVLRKKGCSFAQLTLLLNQSGFKLQPATVRTYYNELLASKMELCEGRMDEQLVVLAKVQEITRGTEISTIAAKVAAIKESQRAAVASRVDAVFTQVVPMMPSQNKEKMQSAAPSVREKTPPPSAAISAQSEIDESGFGLLAGASTNNATVEVRPGAGFFALDDGAPQVPVMDELHSAVPALARTGNMAAPATPATKFSKPVSEAVATSIRCAGLQLGVEPLEKRAGLPSEVYDEGLLEHPAIPGLFLTRPERLYGALLEIIDLDGVLRTETLDEKRFRIKWKRPIPAAETESKKRFVPMHHESFGNGKTSTE